jgi:O-antigen ligase/polysaccharide polymerase Wzy-like membrane protein/tetratricopeptide repeat protein
VTRIRSYRPPPLAPAAPAVAVESNGHPPDHAADSPARGFFYLIALGQAALFSLSGLFGGLYDFATWGVLALVSSVLLVTLVLTRRLAVSPQAALALAGVAIIVVWSALSMTWAESVDQAWNEVNRFGFYAITLALVVGAVRTRRQATGVMGMLTAGMALTVLYTVGAMLIGNGGSMFTLFRLEDPLGYVNGMGGLMLMAFWPFLALAEAARRPLLRGAGLGLAVLAGDLVVLTQSRAAVPAVAISALLMLVLLPGRTTRGWALLVACAGVAVSLPAVLDVYGEFSDQATLPADATVRSAAAAACAAAIGAGAIWAIACSVLSQVWRPWLRRVSVGALVAIALAGAGVAVAAVNDPIDRITSEYHAFVSLHVDENVATRFSSGGGFRYDLWRIAAAQFTDSPLRGVGAGNYDTTYYRDRKNPQPAPQPHSLEMQLLAELGIVGLLGLLLLVGGVLWGASRAERPPLRLERWVVVGATGVFLAWLAHTSVDWLHNIAGLTGIALVAAGVVLASPEAANGKRRWAGWGRATVPLIGLVAVLALLAASEGRRWASNYYLERSGSELSADAGASLGDADRALDLNPESLPARYAAARAYARLGRYEPARATLLAATRKEPSDYVPWVLLGDLAVRHGDLARARASYRRATALSPYDTNFSVAASRQQLRKG